MSHEEQSEYGIYRANATKTSGPGWRVFFQRQGQRVSRAFQDSVYGTDLESKCQALAYRDAVLDLLPPRTTLEQAVLLKSSNESGISGIRYSDSGSGPFWMASASTPDGRKFRYFSVADHGYEGARELAILQRVNWLAEGTAKFVPTTAFADAVATTNFSRHLHPQTDAFPQRHMDDGEVKALLAQIDARFDTLRPPKLIVRLRCVGDKSLMGYVSTGDRPARSKQFTLGIRRTPITDAAESAFVNITVAIEAFFNTATAEWFQQEYRRPLIQSILKYPKTGFSEKMFIPLPLVPEHPASALRC